jgi:hypothetical protein
MWPVDEVDDGEEPPVPDFVATEARIGPPLRAARCDSVARRRRLGVGCALEALSRVPDGQAEIFACADNFHGPRHDRLQHGGGGTRAFRTVRARQDTGGGDHDIIWKQLASY